MHWLLLTGAIVAEVIGTLALKMSNGFTVLVPSLVVGIGYLTAFALLGLSLKVLDVGTAYAIWAGVGTALVSIAGVILFKEPMTAMKTASVVMIIAGVVGLHLAERGVS